MQLIQPLLLILTHLQSSPVAVPNVTIDQLIVFITHISGFSVLTDLIPNIDQTVIFTLLSDENPVGFVFLCQSHGG